MDEKRIYVGNIPYDYDDNKLKDLFAEYGEVTEVRVIIDKASGRSKGFGFVAMQDKEMADKAVKELNGKEIDGRAIVVNIARPMTPR
ncbi:MAG: RNA-binding protein [bacterium]|nr:RNA-binding protein [bacterium]